MKAPLTSLINGISELRKYIEIINSFSALVKKSPQSDIAVAIRDFPAKRQLDYNCIIVTLYGLLEQYVEALLAAYIDSYTQIVPRYSYLPSDLRKAHIHLVVDHLQRATKLRYRGQYDVSSLVKGLNSCLEDREPYHLIADSFTHHTTNVRVEAVDEMFKRVGLIGVSRRAVKTDIFKEFLDNEDPKRSINSDFPERCLIEIDDLAERRNEVSHGLSSNIVSNEILLGYLQIVEVYCKAIYAVVVESSLPYLAQHRGVELGDPIAVFNNEILCVSTKGYEVKQGDTLVLETADPQQPYMQSVIGEIQIEGKSVEKVLAGEPVDIGMKINVKPKMNHKVYLVRPL